MTKNNFKKVNFYKKFILLLKILMTVWTDSNYMKRRKGSKEVFDGYFKFEGRYIWYYGYKTKDNDTLHLYLEEKLHVEEEKDFLERIENGSKVYTIE